MSTAIAKTANTSGLSTMAEDELIGVLQSSLYPGASIPSIKMVLGYCRAAGLDPMQKPVHIVPMWDSKAGAMRDVVMPGIGLYRTQAARSGQYAGVTDSEFGPDVTENIGGIEITYPQWCRVAVKRSLPSGQIVEFAAKEFWKENYAVKGGKEKSIAPNAMWQKRPYGQIAKCAEAQALRKAFPEFGAAPTADEMEGRSFDDGSTVIDGNTGEILNKKEAAVYSEADFQKNFQSWSKLIQSGKKSADDIIRTIESRAALTEEQKAKIRAVKPASPDGEMSPEEVEAIRQREMEEAGQA